MPGERRVMTMSASVRWGIVGTAKIARNLFLPSLR
jgi:hypothetical protein